MAKKQTVLLSGKRQALFKICKQPWERSFILSVKYYYCSQCSGYLYILGVVMVYLKDEFRRGNSSPFLLKCVYVASSYFGGFEESEMCVCVCVLCLWELTQIEWLATRPCSILCRILELWVWLGLQISLIIVIIISCQCSALTFRSVLSSRQLCCACTIRVSFNKSSPDKHNEVSQISG